MKLKIYKSACLFSVIFLTAYTAVFAQDVSVSVSTSKDNTVAVKTKFNEKKFEADMDDFGKNLTADLKNMAKNLSISLNDMSPRIKKDLDKLNADLNVSTNFSITTEADSNYNATENTSNDNDDAGKSERLKTYSKTYPIDANDNIKLSNQFGRITVTTWDRHEVKVDIQIKAESNDDDDAQRLLDGVQISDSKNGDQVSFRTDIGHNNSSWKVWSWGSSNNKVRKVTINYTVYMPAKTDLNIEQSYGSIVLPDLDGRVKLSSAYGSVSIQNLSNPNNDIEGSYGSLKMGSMNSGKLEFAYGSVDVDECTNLKADLSYGSFKLGRLKGAADLNLSNVGGVSIGGLGSGFRKLNINSSYSSVGLNVSDNNNFDFDITTTYGGFKYNDSKVNITSKTPADGSRYFSNTKNYKGHYGKGGDAQVNIHSSYGGVSFE